MFTTMLGRAVPAAALFALLVRASASATGPAVAAAARPAAGDVPVAIVNELALAQTLAASGTPGSPSFRRRLTPAAFDAAFAPSPQQEAAVAAELVRDGFHITHTFSNRTVIDAVAPPAVALRTFGAVDGIAGVPAHLRPLVSGVFGLGRAPRTLPFGAEERASDEEVVPHDNGLLYGPDGGYSPFAVETAYHFPLLTAYGGYDGSGTGVALVLWADFRDADLATYLSEFGITRTGPATVRVPVDGGAGLNAVTPYTTLDAEAVVGNASGTAFDLYTIPSFASNYVIDAFNAVVNADQVNVLLAGFAYCEATDGGLSQSLDAIAQQAALLGMTVVAGSGDAGSFACGSFDLPAVAGPANSPNVVGVGGTRLSIDAKGKRTGERAWPYSGGGLSTTFGTPAYQAGAPFGLSSGRNVPDLAFDASGATPLSAYAGGKWVGKKNNGTSASSGQAAALIAELDEQASAQGAGRPVFPNELYTTFAGYGVTNGWFDVLHGCSVLGSGFPGYCAGPVYDDITGIGVPYGNGLAARLGV